ncbi:MAG: ArsR/SmtB family transcription factor [Candidatus Acidiferrales bacterium]
MTPSYSARRSTRRKAQQRTRIAGRRALLSGPADVYLAIADHTRRRLLDLLGTGEQHVNALAAPFRMSRPAVSQHLRILRRVGLVDVRRDGRERRYRVRGEKLREVFDWVAHYEKFWKQKLEALGKYLDSDRENATPMNADEIDERG